MKGMGISMIENWLQQSPKIDLHCHLDGSLSIPVVEYLLKDLGIVIEDDLEKRLRVAPDCTSLTEYLTKFDLPIQCLQTEKGLTLAAYDLLKNAANENVTYLELRFAPMFHLQRGLKLYQVLEAVISGIKKAKEDFSIDSSIIVCGLRHFSAEQNIEMLKVACEYREESVCALDLAGDESSYPTYLQRELFAQAVKWRMPFTIHAGECGSVEEVREAVHLGAKRIGHGIALIKDQNLLNSCRQKRIGIEVCPTSNFQTKAASSWADYPLKAFMEHGLLVTVNTDNRLVSGITSTGELDNVYHELSLEKENICNFFNNAIEISFANDNIKDRLLKEMERSFC